MSCRLAARPAAATAPVLALVGELDASDIQAIVDLLVMSVPGAKKLVLPGAGQVPSLEQPEALNRTLLAFLDGPKWS